MHQTCLCSRVHVKKSILVLKSGHSFGSCANVSHYKQLSLYLPWYGTPLVSLSLISLPYIYSIRQAIFLQKRYKHQTGIASSSGYIFRIRYHVKILASTKGHRMWEIERSKITSWFFHKEDSETNLKFSLVIVALASYQERFNGSIVMCELLNNKIFSKPLFCC